MSSQAEEEQPGCRTLEAHCHPHCQAHQADRKAEKDLGASRNIPEAVQGCGQSHEKYVIPRCLEVQIVVVTVVVGWFETLAAVPRVNDFVGAMSAWSKAPASGGKTGGTSSSSQPASGGGVPSWRVRWEAEQAQAAQSLEEEYGPEWRAQNQIRETLLREELWEVCVICNKECASLTTVLEHIRSKGHQKKLGWYGEALALASGSTLDAAAAAAAPPPAARWSVD